MAREATKRSRGRPILRRIILGGLTLTIVMMAVLAWSWRRSVPMKRVVVSGAIHADSAEVVRYAGLESDSVGLFAIEPDVLVDRVRRTPWVRDAAIRRLPSGTVSIRIEEREPVVLVVTPDGRPGYYLDAEGFAMPLVPSALYDVPLLRGRVPANHATRAIQNPAVLELLQALSEADLETDALLSEIALGKDGDAVLRTSPAEGHGSVSVRLGAGNYAAKLQRLRAFWHQALLTRPELTFQSIDLRFDGQIVTHEDSTTVSTNNHPQPQSP